MAALATAAVLLVCLATVGAFSGRFDLGRRSAVIATAASRGASSTRSGLLSSSVDDSVFGREFTSQDISNEQQQQLREDEEGEREPFAPTKSERELAGVVYWKGKSYKRIPMAKSRGEVMAGFDNLRATFFFDSVFISGLGLCLAWFFGSFKDAYSYGIGSLFGLGYAVLLGRYVEGLGGGGGGGGGARSSAGGGAARFAPVILLIVLYGKYKAQINIIPELVGFFSYQVASLLQIFNADAYGEGSGNGDGADEDS